MFHFFHYMVHGLKLFREVEIIYMVVGHTKFSCDRIIGHAKSKYLQAEKIVGID